MVLRPFTRLFFILFIYFFTWPFIVAVSACCQKLLVTQIVSAILETTDNTSTQEIEVRK